jgi:U6 snRNA-associated Sm-like protein LSm8
MAQVLDAYVNKSVNIVTSDGRIIIGTLRGFDQTINIILDDSHERVFSATDGVEQVPLGLYIIRGDNVALIGEIDEELDRNIDLSHTRADPIRAAKT